MSDAYNGATLDFVVADSCDDGNAWCKDDPYHVDLAQASLNQFILNGQPVGNMYPGHWNNRQVSWQFIAAPNYTGDIRIGAIQGAQPYWPAIAISHLPNGIHGVQFSALTASIVNSWPGGYQVQFTVANNGTAPGTGWTAGFSFGDPAQTIASSWSATVSQSGQKVSASNASYDGAIPPGGSVTWGMVAGGDNQVLSGLSCTVS